MNLKEWRVAKGLSQAEAAATLGLAQATVSRIETGRNKPDWATMQSIMEKTGGAVTPNDFLIESRNESHSESATAA